MVPVIAKAWRKLRSHIVPGTVGRPAAPGLPDEALVLLGLPNYAALWSFAGHRTPIGPDFLRTPIGVDENGTPVLLDLKESRQDGMGPHGVIIGATGSGKSELLRTIVLALAARHSSADLNIVLIDFKGEATFAPLSALPHTSAVITNLADELPLVNRIHDVLTGEMVRRQEMLRTAGTYVSQFAYEKARAAGAPLEPMPTLLIVCDDFSELITVNPDLINLFVRIGRLGHSLGIHLLLASQRLEENKLRGLDARLSYRIALRTFSAIESQIVLGVPDAYELPTAPGHGYLKTGTAMVRFRATFVSGLPAVSGADAGSAIPLEFAGRSLLEIVIQRLHGTGPDARQIWLPPLAEPPTLDELMPLTRDPERGFTAAAGTGSLTAPIGIIDRPLEQRRDRLLVELAGAAGHVAIVGAPLSGKSALLRTMLLSLALTHTPREVQFFCLDFGGGALHSLIGLPHLSGVAGRRDTEAVRRTAAEVVTLLQERETRFAEHQIESMASYRQRRAAGEFTDDPYGDVFLVVDGWNVLRLEYDDLEETINLLAQRGLRYGVHVVLTAIRWSEFRVSLRDLLGTKLELRLSDPYDSEVDRRVARNVPDASPGRGLTRDKLHFLAALSRVDGRHDVEDLAEATAALTAQIAQAWPG